MRIVHVIDHFQPWMGYQETYLAREQARQGHDVTVVTSNRYGKVAGDLAGQHAVDTGRRVEEGIDVVRLPVVFETPTGAGYVWMRGLSMTLAGLRPDAVHCHGVLTFTALQVAWAKRHVGFRLIYDNHMADFNVYSPTDGSLKGRAKRIVYPGLGRLASPLVLRRADAIVAIGEPERAFIQWLFGRRCPEVPIVRLGADSGLFTFQPEGRARLRWEQGWSDADVVLGHAGTVRRSKGIDRLIRAAGQLVAEGLPVRVSIVGRIDAEHRAELDAEVATQGLAGRVVFKRFVAVESLPEYLSAMDVAVWPGDISNTAIEAMSIGLPVVAARTPYTESVIEQHGAGILFDPSEDGQLVNALGPLVRDPDYRRTVAGHAREAVERELNWPSIAGQFVELYCGSRQPELRPSVMKVAR